MMKTGSVLVKRRSKHQISKARKRPSLNLRLGLAVLLGVLLLVFLGKTLSIIVRISQPWAPDGNTTTKITSWDHQSVLNLVFKSDKLYLLSINPITLSATVVTVSDQTLMLVPGGYGSWQVGSLYQLGQSEKSPTGAELLKKSLSSNLGVAVDGYLLLLGQETNHSPQQLLEELRRSPWSGLNLIGNCRTDLSLPELVNLILTLRSIRSDKVDSIDLENSTLTHWKLLADGSRVLALDPTEVDQYNLNHLTDNLISQENLTIGIYNSTVHPQMAEKAARIVTNLGGRVVFTGNSQDNLPKSIVVGKNSRTLTRLESIFSAKCISPNESFFKKAVPSGCDIISTRSGSDLNFSRADITVVLGEDYYEANTHDF